MRVTKLNYIVLAAVLAIVVLSCSNPSNSVSDKDSSLTLIDSLENAFFETEATKNNSNTGMSLIREYARYYQNSEKDSLAIDLLFKAGEVSMGIGQGNLAVKYFKTLTKEHQDFGKAAEAMFLCGFCSENLNSDTAEARFYYEKFIRIYPKHHLVEDARFSVLNLGMSDAQLIEQFEQNQVNP